MLAAGPPNSGCGHFCFRGHFRRKSRFRPFLLAHEIKSCNSAVAGDLPAFVGFIRGGGWVSMPAANFRLLAPWGRV